MKEFLNNKSKDTIHLRLLSEWDMTKNELKINEVPLGSTEKVWWICENGHSYQAVMRDRARRGTGCPYCAGRKAIKGENDLETLCPEIAKEWNYEKNKNLLPSDVTRGSDKKVWWKCSKGHEWEAKIANRTINKRACPFCSGRFPIKGLTDFSSRNPEIVKEWNYEKNGELYPEDVTYGSGKKVWWKCSKGHEWEALVKDRHNNRRGCPYCSGKKVIVGENDLETVYPDIAMEWNYQKNGKLIPRETMCGSSKKVWWKCSKGHEWEASVSKRTKLKRGCPYCSGSKPIKGETDFESCYKDLLVEWDYHKNKMKPYEVSCYSNKKVWWICEKGHSYEASVTSRTRLKSGCPYCAKHKPIHGETDALTFNSNIEKIWNYEKNTKMPYEYSPYSGKRVWWKCSKGHEWKSCIENVVGKGRGCPHCYRE